MKTLKFQIDDKIAESLDRLAADLGLKTNAYIQMILGLHVKEKEAKDGSGTK